MKSAADWAGEMCINSEIVMVIQRDALLEAAEIVMNSGGSYATRQAFYDAILARAKEVEDK